MDGYQFVLGILVLIFLGGCHRRWIDYHLKKQFLEYHREDNLDAFLSGHFHIVGQGETYDGDE